MWLFKGNLFSFHVQYSEYLSFQLVWNLSEKEGFWIHPPEADKSQNDEKNARLFVERQFDLV